MMREKSLSSAKRLLRFLPAYALIGISLFLAEISGLNASVDHQLAEWRFAVRPRDVSGQVVLVDIDAHSLAEVGVWPWPRQLYGDLVRRAAEAGARTVAFDIDFSAASFEEADQTFAAALSASGIETFLAAFVQLDSAAGQRTRLSLPIESLLQASWPAAVNVLPDGDGRIRRLPLDVSSDGEPVTAMPSLLAGRSASDGHDGIDFSIAADRLQRVSFVDLLQSRVAPEILAGKTLIIGASAIELRDLFPIPVHGVVSGATILALATETLVQGRELRLLGHPWWALALLGAAGWVAFRRLRLRHASLVAALLALAIEAAAFALQEGFRIVPATAGLHILVVVLVVLVLMREFDLRRVLLWLAEARSRNTQNLLERVVDDGFDGVVIFDETFGVTRSNGEACRLLGRTAEQPLLRLDDLPGPIRADIRAAADAFRNGGASAKVLKSLDLADLDRVLEYTVAPFSTIALDEARQSDPRCRIGLCLTLRDVTERERAGSRIRFLALHDSLTGLGNRHALEKQFGELQPESTEKGHALLSFDLDRFKTINDSLGHGVGDKVLVEVGERARAVFEGDGFLSRLGGDEFAVLLPRTDLASVRRKGEDLVASIARPFFVGGHRVGVGTSVGIAWWQGTAESVSSAMRHSDVALYRAKRSPSQKVVVFEPSMEADRLVRLEMERDLLRAIDAGEMELAYQPQVRLRTGEAVGAEALLRWRHPQKGFVSPAIFVPVAEEMGLIHRLGAFALETACREAANWPGGIKVAVNVSALQISAGDLVQTVERALATSALPSERLELEITESAFVDESDGLKDTFSALQAMKVRFALDDFGTGYSSLGYLHRFPVSKIKIDRSFVTGVPKAGASMAVLRSVMALAEGLGIRTIAEGIETDEEAETLRILGCDDGQGYLFAKPLTASDFAAWLRADRTAAEMPLRVTG